VKPVREIVRDEQGVAVILAVLVLLALTALVAAFLAVSAFEPQISANLAAATQARYVAEAGIEAAFDGLANNPNWSLALAGSSCSANGGVLAPGTSMSATLPGLTVSAGRYTVRVRNDCFAGDATTSADSLITGVPLDPTALVDTNNRLILISTGTFGTATRTIKVVVKKPILNLPTINGALTFPGLEADVNFSGSAFDIRGVDTNMDDTPGPANPVLGIAVGTAGNELGVRNALGNNQDNSVIGLDVEAPPTNPNQTAQGARTIGYDGRLTQQAITDFVNNLKSAADITVTSSPSSRYEVRDVGASCAGNINSSTCWGTVATPKIVYIKGVLPSDTTQFTALDISGNSAGTGILIIENGQLEITGNFRWNGPIIVTGKNTGIIYKGGGKQSVYGVTIVNETRQDGSANLEGDIRGNAKILYSTQALNLVMNGLNNRSQRKNMALYSWQEQ
jgi:hypothetical protein